MMTEKQADGFLRRVAQQQGYTLKKSRAKESLDNRGGYMIVDENNAIIAGERYDMSIEDVADYLEVQISVD